MTVGARLDFASMRKLFSHFFRRCASLVGVPAIHQRLDRLEEVSARKVDIEGLQRAIQMLESRVLDMDAALVDHVEKKVAETMASHTAGHENSGR